MDTLYKFELKRERLNSGGYTSGGSYFGTGQPLYVYVGRVETTDNHGAPDTMQVYLHLRAHDREDAKAQIRKRYPKAKFYR